MPLSKSPTGPGYVRLLVSSPRPSGSLSPIPSGCLGLSRKASINPLSPSPNLPRLLSLGFPAAKGPGQGQMNHQPPSQPLANECKAFCSGTFSTCSDAFLAPPPVVSTLGVPGITLEWQLVDWWRLQRSPYSTLHPLFVRASQAITATPRWVPHPLLSEPAQ